MIDSQRNSTFFDIEAQEFVTPYKEKKSDKCRFLLNLAISLVISALTVIVICRLADTRAKTYVNRRLGDSSVMFLEPAPQSFFTKTLTKDERVEGLRTFFEKNDACKTTGINWDSHSFIKYIVDKMVIVYEADAFDGAETKTVQQFWKDSHSWIGDEVKKEKERHLFSCLSKGRTTSPRTSYMFTVVEGPGKRKEVCKMCEEKGDLFCKTWKDKESLGCTQTRVLGFIKTSGKEHPCYGPCPECNEGGKKWEKEESKKPAKCERCHGKRYTNLGYIYDVKTIKQLNAEHYKETKHARDETRQRHRDLRPKCPYCNEDVATESDLLSHYTRKCTKLSREERERVCQVTNRRFIGRH